LLSSSLLECENTSVVVELVKLYKEEWFANWTSGQWETAMLSRKNSVSFYLFFKKIEIYQIQENLLRRYFSSDAEPSLTTIDTLAAETAADTCYLGFELRVTLYATLSVGTILFLLTAFWYQYLKRGG